MNNFLEQEKQVSKAFSKQAAIFDEEDLKNPILQWMRSIVRKSVLSNIKKDARILELNCGTGIDSVFFAEKNFHITATDISYGMLHELKKKTAKFSLEKKISIAQFSFNELSKLQPEKFDYVFSNFGGLNCAPNLHQIIQNLKLLLNPDAGITLVIMPRFCLWELALVLKGNFKTAFRRLKKNGASSNVEGINFKTWYYSPQHIAKAFGKDFEVKESRALGIFVPPPYLFRLAVKYPVLFRFSTKLDEKFSSLKFLSGMGDHFLITLRKTN